MPTIQKLERKEKTNQRNPTERREQRRKAYNDTRWRKLRQWYFSLHPLCEVCLSKGKVVPGHDIHHKRTPFKADGVDWTLMLDPDNLETVCPDCHGDIHAAEQGHINPARMIELLDALFEDVEDNEDK